MPRKLFLRTMVDKDVHIASMRDVGACDESIDIMAAKSGFYSFLYKELDPRGANILKQEMLAVGGEAAISYEAMSDWEKPTDVLITGTERQLEIAVLKLKNQPFGLKKLGSDLEDAISVLNTTEPRKVDLGTKTLEAGGRTLVMGILNVTPDSFSDGGKFADPDEAIEFAKIMVEQGADIIDVGGESTRPGAESIGLEEEEKRVLPVIEGLSGFGIPISIDTRKPEVARKALEAGASMVNLVGGLRDDEMIEVVANANVPVVLMHMQGEPDDMQNSPEYDNVMDDIIAELDDQINQAVEGGIDKTNIIVDPGIGFGKTVEHNLEIIRRLGEMKILDAPILIGTSRKSFIGKLTGMDADDRLEGSLASTVLAAANGADIVRVHEVRETKKALAISDAINK